MEKRIKPILYDPHSRESGKLIKELTGKLVPAVKSIAEAINGLGIKTTSDIILEVCRGNNLQVKELYEQLTAPDVKQFKSVTMNMIAKNMVSDQWNRFEAHCRELMDEAIDETPISDFMGYVSFTESGVPEISKSTQKEIRQNFEEWITEPEQIKLYWKQAEVEDRINELMGLFIAVGYDRVSHFELLAMLFKESEGGEFESKPLSPRSIAAYKARKESQRAKREAQNEKYQAEKEKKSAEIANYMDGLTDNNLNKLTREVPENDDN